MIAVLTNADGTLTQLAPGADVKFADGSVLGWDEIAQASETARARLGISVVRAPDVPPGKAVRGVTFSAAADGKVGIAAVDFIDLPAFPIATSRLVRELDAAGLFDAFAESLDKRPALERRFRYGALIFDNDPDLRAVLEATGFDPDLLRARQAG